MEVVGKIENTYISGGYFGLNVIMLLMYVISIKVGLMDV